MKLAFAHGLGSMRICAYANLGDGGGQGFRGVAGGQRPLASRGRAVSLAGPLRKLEWRSARCRCDAKQKFVLS